MKISKSTKFDCFDSNIRVKLIICLEKKKTVTDLLELCDLSQSSLSQHLKVLKDAKVIGCKRNGQKQIYGIKNKEALKIAKLINKLK